MEQNAAFEKIKELLTSAPILTCPNFLQPFQLETDASDTELVTRSGFNSSHKRKKLCNAYASGNLNSAASRYSTSEKECLAVVWAIRKCRPYLDGL